MGMDTQRKHCVLRRRNQGNAMAFRDDDMGRKMIGTPWITTLIGPGCKGYRPGVGNYEVVNMKSDLIVMVKKIVV